MLLEFQHFYEKRKKKIYRVFLVTLFKIRWRIFLEGPQCHVLLKSHKQRLLRYNNVGFQKKKKLKKRISTCAKAIHCLHWILELTEWEYDSSNWEYQRDHHCKSYIKKSTGGAGEGILLFTYLPIHSSSNRFDFALLHLSFQQMHYLLNKEFPYVLVIIVSQLD